MAKKLGMTGTANELTCLLPQKVGTIPLFVTDSWDCVGIYIEDNNL